MSRGWAAHNNLWAKPQRRDAKPDRSSDALKDDPALFCWWRGVGPGLLINNTARRKCIPNDVWRILEGSGRIPAAGEN